MPEMDFVLRALSFVSEDVGWPLPHLQNTGHSGTSGDGAVSGTEDCRFEERTSPLLLA